MSTHRLASFIHDQMEAILQEWEDFARTIEPPALTMDDVELRDHARQMLQAISKDLTEPQSDQQREEKSQGQGPRTRHDSAAEVHAEARLRSGYTVVQLVSEYRALRSSVLTLWAAHPQPEHDTDMGDVTRFNEAIDQALAESVARYEKMVNQSRNMFLAILGHDLRNPLGTIVTGASFITQAVDIAPKYVLVANRVFNSAQRMSRLISDLIDFTRTHLGQGIPVKPKPNNVSRVCNEAVNELRTFHPEQMIECVAPDHLEAHVDEARLAQVLSNLIGNAIQYGGRETPVSVALGTAGENVVITVNNRGSVIAPDMMTGVFDPLVRMATSENTSLTERTSLGIGLFISREIIQAHGGDICVVSTEKEGTTFTVTIPRRPPAVS